MIVSCKKCISITFGGRAHVIKAVAIIVPLSALDILLFILSPSSIQRISVTAIDVPRFDYFHSRNRLSLLV